MGFSMSAVVAQDPVSLPLCGYAPSLPTVYTVFLGKISSGSGYHSSQQISCDTSMEAHVDCGWGLTLDKLILFDPVSGNPNPSRGA